MWSTFYAYNLCILMLVRIISYIFTCFFPSIFRVCFSFLWISFELYYPPCETSLGCFGNKGRLFGWPNLLLSCRPHPRSPSCLSVFLTSPYVSFLQSFPFSLFFLHVCFPCSLYNYFSVYPDFLVLMYFNFTSASIYLFSRFPYVVLRVYFSPSRTSLVSLVIFCT